eukprot:34443_3
MTCVFCCCCCCCAIAFFSNSRETGFTGPKRCFQGEAMGNKHGTAKYGSSKASNNYPSKQQWEKVRPQIGRNLLDYLLSRGRIDQFVCNSPIGTITPTSCYIR